MRPVPAIALLLAACSPGPHPEPPALKAAEAKLAEGRFGEALKDLKSFAPADLADPAARLRAAEAAKKCREFALVARFLEPDAAPRPKANAPARLLRAEGLLRSGDIDGAKRALTEMELDGIRPERWRFLYALMSLARGDRDVGMRELEGLVGEGSRDPEVLYRWAERCLPLHAEVLRRFTESLERATDRGPVLAAFGAFLLLRGVEPQRAFDLLEEAVRLCPWNRDARLDLVRAGLGRGEPASVARSVEEAGRVVAQDPGDPLARLLLAESLGEKGRLALTPGVYEPTPAAVRAWDQAEKEYAELGRRGVTEPAMAIRALHGWARIHVEEIPLDPTGKATGPGTHYEKAMENLARAEALDPAGKLEGGPHGSFLLAETFYLRGRAARKAHTGDSDHTDALGWFKRAFEKDGRHLAASWDLGLLCHDFFPGSKEYQDLAATAFQIHFFMREQLGLPPLGPEQRAIVEETMKKTGRDLPPGWK